MKLTRRHTLMVAFGSAVAAMLPVRAFAALEDDIPNWRFILKYWSIYWTRHRNNTR